MNKKILLFGILIFSATILILGGLPNSAEAQSYNCAYNSVSDDCYPVNVSCPAGSTVPNPSACDEWDKSWCTSCCTATAGTYCVVEKSLGESCGGAGEACADGLACHPDRNVCVGENDCHLPGKECNSGYKCALPSPGSITDACLLPGEGENCTLSAGCTSGYSCVLTGDTGIGTCTATVGLGDSCTATAECGDGLACHPDRNVCVGENDCHLPGKECNSGYICGTSASGNITDSCRIPTEGENCTLSVGCTSGYSCVLTGSTGIGTCTATVGLGNSCAVTAECGDGLACYEGSCIYDHDCRIPGNECTNGEKCGLAGDGTAGDVYACYLPLGGAGDSCTPSRGNCIDGFVCSVTGPYDAGICEAEGAAQEGEACVTTAACADGLACFRSVCTSVEEMCTDQREEYSEDILVPCGGPLYDPDTGKIIGQCPRCTLRDVFVLLHNLVDLIIWTIAPALVGIMVVYGGIMILTGAGNPSQVGKGKKIITWALIGYIIVLTAWIVVNLILTVIGLAEWIGPDKWQWYNPTF
ncbi:MAG: pilin [Candidatus Spechtbacterales bacterium]|nr:pilin [Candidatus Spechtbacterales bacterium]